MITQELLEAMLAQLQDIADQLDNAEQNADDAFSHAEDLANEVQQIKADFADLQETFEKALGEVATL
jgi:methyl-accepting chemotaxis protein